MFALQHVKAGLSIGGWTGSMNFSNFMASNESSSEFVKSISSIVTQYKFDVVEFE